MGYCTTNSVMSLTIFLHFPGYVLVNLFRSHLTYRPNILTPKDLIPSSKISDKLQEANVSLKPDVSLGNTKQKLKDKVLCPKLTFWERSVCVYDQALMCYCLHSKAHAWLTDTILNVFARAVFCSWVAIG